MFIWWRERTWNIKNVPIENMYSRPNWLSVDLALSVLVEIIVGELINQGRYILHVETCLPVYLSVCLVSWPNYCVGVQFILWWYNTHNIETLSSDVKTRPFLSCDNVAWFKSIGNAIVMYITRQGKRYICRCVGNKLQKLLDLNTSHGLVDNVISY